MDPQIAVSLALAVLDETLNMVREIKGQSGLTVDQLHTQADAQDLNNKDAIKKLLAL